MHYPDSIRSLSENKEKTKMTIKTGEKAPLKGIYSWVRNIDKPYCTPTANEKEIPLDQGDVAPPVRSCESAAVWQWARSS
jgi:hypothetical protein